MKWRDPVDGHVFWEPPGGGIEPGETPREAATRELYEETGLTLNLQAGWIPVERDYHWLGRHFVHLEAFFCARADSAEPRLAAPTADELDSFLAWQFVRPLELDQLNAPLEPPGLPAVLAAIRPR